MGSLDEVDLLAQVLLAARRVSTAGLAVEGLALVGPQPVGQRREGRRDVIRHALGVGARVVRVEVLCFLSSA